MGKYIGMLLAIVAIAASQLKGWTNMSQNGMGGVYYKPPTLKSQFSKSKGFKKHKRK